MAAIRKTDEDRSVYDNLDDIVRELSALRDQADEEVLPRLARQEAPEPEHEPPEPVVSRATVRPLHPAPRVGSVLKPRPAVPAPEAIKAPAPQPEPPSEQAPPRPSTRDRADPLPAFLRTAREKEEAERRRRKPIRAAVIGICAASAIVLLGFGAYTFLGRGEGTRLAEAHTPARLETAASTLTGSMLLQSAQRRSPTSVEPTPLVADVRPATSTQGEAAASERAAALHLGDERPRALEMVIPPASAAPAAEQPAAALTPPPIAPLAQAQPEPAAPPPAETQMAALPPPAAPAAPVPQRPRFSTEETGRLIARARSMIDTSADIAGARLLLQRAADMGDPAASFALAETFDPNVLSRMRVFGIRGDAAMARRLYQQALDGGVENARPRLATLGN